MKKQILFVIMVALFSTPLFAQEFNLSGELRPRFEHKNGYRTLSGEGNSWAWVMITFKPNSFTYKVPVIGDK